MSISYSWSPPGSMWWLTAIEAVSFYADAPPQAYATTALTFQFGDPPGGPVYTPTTERIYRRLPEVYRVLDARNGWHLKKYISAIGDQLNDIDVLIARLTYVPPEGWASYLGTLNQYNTYARPSGITDPAIGETSDLLDGRTADAAWLPYLAQLLGALTDGITNEADLRDAVTNNFLGYQAGSHRALEAATRSLLTGTKTVTIRTHDDGLGGPALGGEVFTDGGFEVDAGGWVELNASMPMAISTVAQRLGTQALGCARTVAITADTGGLTTTIGVVSGTQYRFSAYIRSDPVQPNFATVHVDVDGVAGTPVAFTDTNYHYFEVDFTASSDLIAIDIRESNGGANVGFVVDDTSFREILTIGTSGEWYDVTIVTLGSETALTSTEMVDAVIAKGAKPAGIQLHHVLADPVSSGILDKPVITHTGTGQFTITNYNPSYTYHLSTGTRSGSVITLSNPNGTATVYVTSGPDASPSTFIERKAYTYTTQGPVESYEVSSPGCPPGWNYEDYGWVKYCRRYTSTKNALPAGYSDSYGEWFRIV